ncbi:MAG TPA: NAD(P) transhydrogenase subunit alpha [Gemmatimonadales bacterium]|nr:NAD(P) transhydrogenase subunit alpha [Gemmatimonadales bacterium]
MRIAVLRESTPHEHRVSLVPASARRLVAAGHAVSVEAEAGEGAGFPDPEYVAAGATVAGSRAALLLECEVALGVQRPPAADLAQLRPGSAVVALIQPATAGEFLAAAAARGVSVLAMELVPRTTKAQTMDVLSSQATVAGYQAVLLGASHCARLLPMLTTAAGTIPPGKAFVLGAGVAGLQAIATARRLGAVVSAFDVRPVVKEQVQSLGASFVEAGEVAGEAGGGYARELAQDQQARVLAAVGAHLPAMDLVITTAAIPGKPAPRLITAAMVASMRPGSVIVDCAVESGGNCELSRPGETVVTHGVTILGPLNLPSQIAQHASVMFSRNIQNLLEYLAKDGTLAISPDDPIAGPMLLAHGGSIPNPQSPNPNPQQPASRT